MSYDYSGLYQFLKQTPEGALRKILIDNKTFTEPHFNLLMKVTRTCDEETFCKNFENRNYPKMRFSPGEEKIREKFWNECDAWLHGRGVLNKGAKVVKVPVAA
ncbi:MAG: hypothetical protein K2Q26_12770 [Bdellovibrionales bacterium]|nr:hypothetical protein [Bdellovibrionales bacterium]